ncbi:hypothetical protein KGD82_27590 (plasmid) [Nocardiopsis eucommiae]|uniref:Uncharacterized protein n=1 Tax=Nocardiopsis eucommiae TaxID=2831970 RepID=A0A975QMC1_9ACTN|nr:hypothetical protein KGD82_27590 [Nocardiopsis eucommiae]
MPPNATTWAPITPADTGLPLPAVYLSADDLTPRTTHEFGAITVGSAMAGHSIPVLQGLALQLHSDDRITLLEVHTQPGPDATVVPATQVQVLAEGNLSGPTPQWTDQARQEQMLILIVGPRQVGELPDGALAFQPDAMVGVAPQALPSQGQ